jgi:hypothetical protein
MSYLVRSVWLAVGDGLKDSVTNIETAVMNGVEEGFDLVAAIPINKSPSYFGNSPSQALTPLSTLQGAILIFKKAAEQKLVDDHIKRVADYFDEFSAAMYGTALPLDALLKEGDFSGTLAEAKSALARGAVARCVKCGEWHCHEETGNRGYVEDAIFDDVKFKASGVRMVRCANCFPDLWEEEMHSRAYWSDAMDVLEAAGFSRESRFGWAMKEQLRELCKRRVPVADVVRHLTE